MPVFASQQIQEPANLLAAWRQLQTELSATPALRQAFRQYEQNLRTHLSHLARRLARGSYRPAAAPGASLLARLEDALVQRATLNALNPLLTHKPSAEVPDARTALHRLRISHARGAEFVVVAALATTPQTLDQTLLLRRLETGLADRPLLELLEQWCAAGLLFNAPAEVAAPPWANAFEALRANAARLFQSVFARGLPQTGADNAEEFAAQVWESAASAHALEDEAVRLRLQQAAWQRLSSALLVTGLTALLLCLYSARVRRLPLLKYLALLSGTSGVLTLWPWLRHANKTRDNTTLAPQTQAALEDLLANELLRDFESAVTKAGWTIVRRGGQFAIPVKDEQSAYAAHSLAEHVLWQLGWQLDHEQTGMVRYAEGEEILSAHFAG
jgi:hypothetical protein